jgi:hypothetical protein
VILPPLIMFLWILNIRQMRSQKANTSSSKCLGIQAHCTISIGFTLIVFTNATQESN